MPSTPTSPYTTSFTAGIRNGTPCSTVVCNIAKRTGKPVSTIYNSLYNCGLCYRTKFNGTWVYWPTVACPKNSTTSNTTQTNMWQSFVDWCMASGCCTPWQLCNNCTSQKNFMNYCRTFFNRQFTFNSKSTPKHRPTPKTSRRTSTSPRTHWTPKHTSKPRWTSPTSKSRWTSPSSKTRWTPVSKKRPSKPVRKYTTNPWNRSSTSTRSYKFPTIKSRSTSRRYVRAA